MNEPRTISDTGFKLITGFETLCLTAYQDQRGVWTIGWGHTANVKQGDVCTRGQADEWLEQDLSDAEECVEDKVIVPLNDNQFAALVSFTFNVGRGAFAASELLQLLNKYWYEQVGAQLLRWHYCNHADNAGLYRRRLAEIALWKTPVSA